MWENLLQKQGDFINSYEQRREFNYQKEGEFSILPKYPLF
jgi:hypothetical protein